MNQAREPGGGGEVAEGGRCWVRARGAIDSVDPNVGVVAGLTLHYSEFVVCDGRFNVEIGVFIE